MEQALMDELSLIKKVDRSLEPAGQARLDSLTKPKGSLGRLEEAALRMYRIQGGEPVSPDPCAMFTAAGDHGAAASGVSLYPQEVTRQMVLNFLAGGAAINVLCRVAGAGLKVVDAGVAGGPFPDHPDLIQRKIGPGTKNLLHEPAMTRRECAAALGLGLELADEAARSGRRSLGAGDMGIGNTTASTALYCAFLGLAPAEITGPGTGLSAQGVRKKAEIIEQALKLHSDVIASKDPLGILAALGGFEIAAIAGLFLGGAKNGLILLVDGFISTAAFVAARALCPAVADYAFFSHQSAEPGHARIMNALGDKPLLDLGMRLGEGTGAAMALFVLRSAAAIFNEMATFADAGVSESS